jgi:small-conductance mechanosensitive channel
MQNFTEWLHRITGLSPTILNNLTTSIIAILILWILRSLILRLVLLRIKDYQARYYWRKISAYITVCVAILVVGRVWFEVFGSLTTFLGLLSAGLAIALKDLVINFAGWAFIMWRRPFQVGDRIQLGSHAGDVIDLRIFQFTLMEICNWIDAEQSTGRILHIPNGQVFSDVLANYSKGFQYIWSEVPVLVTFESNWKKAKEILLHIGAKHAEHLSKAAEQQVKQASMKFMIFYSKLTPTVYTSVKDCGVLLTIRYLCEPRRRRDSEQGIWEEILEEFAKCQDIDFAYPTQRFYNNPLEGKSETKPALEKVEGNDQTSENDLVIAQEGDGKHKVG